MHPGLVRLDQQLARALQKPVDRCAEKNHHAQWLLLCGPCPEHSRCGPEPTTLGRIEPPPDRFWADPFLHRREGRTCVFVEELLFATGRGQISAMELDHLGRPVSDAVPVVRAAHHLSYPFLFEFDGVLYMAPESSGAGRLDLYRCRVFPFDWTFDRTLLRGRAFVDATLFEHQDRWWLFCALREGKLRPNNSLCAYYANTPLATRWRPHPLNPLRRSFADARPAGPLFRDRGGLLLRPSQNCVPRYGYGLNLAEVLELDTERFRERLLWRTTGPQAGGWRALHHMHWSDGLLVMDAQRLIPKERF